MENNKEEIILKKVENKISILNFKKELDTNPLKIKEKGRLYYMKKKIIATTCASVALVSGIVIATNINNTNNIDRGLGKGIETAVENGYIAQPEMEFVKVDNIGVKVKLEDFVMDDLNLSSNFIFEFDESITNSINMEKIGDIELSDLIVRDEENRIIYSSPNQEAFEKYCKENNLNYTFSEFNENYMNNGLNAFIINKSKINATVMYNMYTSDTFPKSRKLYFSFETITLTESTEEKQIKYELNGSWNVTVDVPEQMYNRTEEYYKVVSCDNENFDVYIAKVTNTGLEIGLIVSNIKEPNCDMEKLKKCGTLNEDYASGKISKTEALELENWFYDWKDAMNPIAISNYNAKKERINQSYVENENNEKFTYAESASRRRKGIFLEKDKYEFYETFSMTKYNATNNIRVILYYYGNPVNITLEKI